MFVGYKNKIRIDKKICVNLYWFFMGVVGCLEFLEKYFLWFDDDNDNDVSSKMMMISAKSVITRMRRTTIKKQKKQAKVLTGMLTLLK